MPRLYAFVDTMILLQFRPFQELDWRTLLASDEVELVITRAVLTDLDKHKVGTTPRLRDGARRVRQQLRELYRGQPATIPYTIP